MLRPSGLGNDCARNPFRQKFFEFHHHFGEIELILQETISLLKRKDVYMKLCKNSIIKRDSSLRSE